MEINDKLEKGKMIEFIRKCIPRMNKTKVTDIKKLLEEISLELLINNNKYLLGIKGISEKSVIKIQECIQVYIGVKEMLESINEIEDKEFIISGIYKEIGNNAINLIKENPYCICDKCGMDFNIADKIALSLGFQLDNKNRIKQGIMWVIDNDLDKKGDLFTYKSSIYKGITSCNNNFGEIDLKYIEKALDSLCIDGKIIIEDDNKGMPCIYRSDYYHIEKGIVDNVKSRLNGKGFCESRETVLKHKSIRNYSLSVEQREAVATALTNNICIITGGPGTGKTWIITILLSVIRSIMPNCDAEITAPTGKAAIRVATVTGHEAKTIHRLLNLAVGNSKKNNVNQVQSNFLFVDEASMIDAFLFYQLLINTDGRTNIVIIGDYEQLTSVGPGSILRDLINSKKVPIVTLKQSYRQSKTSLIIKNANILVDKEKTDKEKWLQFDEEQFIFIEETDDKTIDKMLVIIHDLIFDSKYKLDEIMVLSPVKKGNLGINHLNLRLQHWYHDGDISGFKARIMGSDKVVQTVNNYKIGVMNGEVGLIKDRGKIDEGYVYNVIFGKRELQYDDSIIQQLDLAYAITIHKSQGSEYPVIIIPVDDQNMYWANINSIYTAITRAKQKVILIGNKKEFFNAIKGKEQNVRNSRIIEKLNS